MNNKVQQAREKIRRWRENPAQFVVDNFGVDLDAWQVDAMGALGGSYNPKRLLCMKACTGPGKSATLAWMGLHRLACFAAPGEHPKGAALSITKDNLQDNLWAELAKWMNRSEFLRSAFTWTKSNIYANDHPETWFLSARSFAKDADSEAIGRALSGLHSKFPFILLDETGDMPVSVGRAASQIFTGSPVDAAVLQAGNPTSTTGLLHESCGGGGWDVVTITADPDDPKRTPRVSVEHAQAMIDAYGRDNPWVMATILGLFPPTGFNALLGIDEIEAAMARHYSVENIQHAAVVLGGDVAREGDDESMIARRQGLMAYPLRGMRIPDTMLVASQFIQEQKTYDADAFMIDETGGYGAGVIDAMRQLGSDVVGVKFSGAPLDPRYFNKRSEMFFELAKWVKEGGALPKDEKLKQELLAITFSYHKDKFRIVEKDMVKQAIGRSPDRADALALTFAYPVAKMSPFARSSAKDYNPYDMDEKRRTHVIDRWR